METAEAEQVLCAIGGTLNWVPDESELGDFYAQYGEHEDMYGVLNYYQGGANEPTPYKAVFYFNGDTERPDISSECFTTAEQAKEACYHHSLKGRWQ